MSPGKGGNRRMSERDIGKEILQGLRDIKAGKGKRLKVELPDVKAFRKNDVEPVGVCRIAWR
jgi:hypothetical protein